MGGGSKKKRQTEAETQSRLASDTERNQASQLQTELTQRRGLIGSGLPETMQATRTGAENLRNTGGFGAEIEPIQKGYAEFAQTGGFSPLDKEQFLRRSTAPTAAVYGRATDELSRNKALQGGFPGFTESQSRLTRNAAQVGSEASLNANTALAGQVREGRIAGLSGGAGVESKIQQGKIAGQDALQRYTSVGVAGLSDVDINELRNRLQSGQMTQADAQLLTSLASQDKGLFENVMMGIGTVGGATAGVLGAL